MSDEEEYSGGEGEEPEVGDAQEEKVCAFTAILLYNLYVCVRVCMYRLLKTTP